MSDLFSMISAPAQRALSSLGIACVDDLVRHTRFQIESLHGMGKQTMVLIEAMLAASNLSYMDEADDQAVDEYIGKYVASVRDKLNQVRRVIRSSIPDAKEKISYGMPTYYYHENIIHFAGFAKHIGLYPSPSGVAGFEHALKQYTWSKGAIQFPLDEDLPIGLIADIAEYRMKAVKECLIRQA